MKDNFGETREKLSSVFNALSDLTEIEKRLENIFFEAGFMKNYFPSIDNLEIYKSIEEFKDHISGLGNDILKNVSDSVIGDKEPQAYNAADVRESIALISEKMDNAIDLTENKIND